jgi:Family of unknown function (DUF6326)
MNGKNSKNPVNLRIILSALWAARVFSGLQGDSTRFHDPIALNELLAGSSDVPVTDGLLLIMSIILAVPILMIVLSLILPEKANRRANRGIGMFFVAFDLTFFGMALFVWPFSSYEVFWSVMYLLFVGSVTWYAWKWPGQES